MDKNYLKNDCYSLNDIRQAEGLTKQFYQGTFKPVLFKRGNHKLPKNVLCWDLPCKVTCKYNCPNCYAVKAERQYKNRTPLMRAYHYEIIKQALKDNNKRMFLLSYMGKELEKHITYCSKKNLLPIIRIHASGDIFSNEYLEFLLTLIKKYPDVNFYTYTKQLDNETIDSLNKISNLNIVKSIIDINGKKCINYGELDYIYKIQKQLTENNQDCFICSYKILGDNITCMKDCKACLYYSNVLFKQH